MGLSVCYTLLLENASYTKVEGSKDGKGECPAQPEAAVWRRLLGQEAGQRPSFLLRLRHRRFLSSSRAADAVAHRRLLSPLLLPASPAGSRCSFSSTVSALLHCANRIGPPPSLLYLHLSPPFYAPRIPASTGARATVTATCAAFSLHLQVHRGRTAAPCDCSAGSRSYAYSARSALKTVAGVVSLGQQLQEAHI
jgi:hypothetical protein